MVEGPDFALPEGFNRSATKRGKALFSEKATCASCHISPLYTDPGWNLYTPGEVCVDSFQADLAPDKRYRSPPST
jgi:hypothetical protein